MNKEIKLAADEKYIPATKLSAGDISAIYEQGRIRYLSAGSTELVHMIYPALRDENWTTIIPEIHDEKISVQQHSFSISYSAAYQQNGIAYKASYRIEGGADNTISFSMRGEALSAFMRRRIGLCLLQPISSCAGRDIEVIQPDGKSYSSAFPEFVSPFQPFLNVHGMKWITENNIFVEVKYEGDVFETEDQRNWSDNSYKTYSTPQSLPAPAPVAKGDVVEQKITIRVNTTKATSRPRPALSETRHPLPKIGYAMPKDAALTATQLDLLKKIPLDHVLVQIDLSGDWKKTWSDAVDRAGKLNTSVELFVIFDKLNEEETGSMIEALLPSKKMISSILVLSAHHDAAPLEFFEKAYHSIKNSLGNVAVGYGSNANFAELNRNRPGNIEYDFVNFHVQPQVHLVDSRSIMENITSYETLIRSAKKFTGDKAVHVSPVDFSGNRSDPRFHTSFAAWWTLQALRNLSTAVSLTFHELTGEEGVLDGERSTPLYEALKAIKDFKATHIVVQADTAVVFENAEGSRLLFTSQMEALS